MKVQGFRVQGEQLFPKRAVRADSEALHEVLLGIYDCWSPGSLRVFIAKERCFQGP